MAWHIVGGDLYYECLGNDQYRITLKVYRDCYASGQNVADYDAPAHIGIYDGSGLLYDVVDEFLVSRTNIPPETNNPCLQAPANICVEEGIYSFISYLPPTLGGYDIVYERCCRNQSIVNIVAPSETGATYTAHIPDEVFASCNSSPYFNDFPPIVICAGEPLNFDHSATDPDGDFLLYYLCTPFTGADNFTPQPLVPAPPPFTNVAWQPGFSGGNPLTASPGLAINPNTGLLTGTPTAIGQYVVGVCVDEYRNGTRVGTSKRDFQFNVVACQSDVQAIVPVIDSGGATIPGTAGVYIYQCDGYAVTFDNHSINGTYYRWDFGDTTTTGDVSTAFEPSYIYPDTGVYVASLIVNPGYVCADTTSVTVRIYPYFNTQFDHIPVCDGEAVDFTDQTIATLGNIDSWQWFFGDGGFSSQPNPQHLYNGPGNYNVTLQTTSDKGCRDIVAKVVTVYPYPQADFSYSPTCIYTPVDFTDQTSLAFGDLASWEWQLGNNVIDTNQDATLTYQSLATYNIQLAVASDFSCKDTIQKTIMVHPLPLVTTSGDTSICVGESAVLNATGGATYAWSPSTGLSNAQIATPIASPTATQTYIVNVTDSNSCQQKDSLVLTVHPLPGTDAGMDTIVCIGNSYQLMGSGGAIFEWAPANLVTDPNIPQPHTVPSDTTTYYLTSYSSYGCKNQDSVTLFVQFPVTANGTAFFEICVRDSIQLNASGGLYYQWTSANTGNTLEATDKPWANPNSDEVYEVTVSNDCFRDSFSVEITVHPLPSLDAGNDTTIYRDEQAHLLALGSGVEYVWTPENGLSSPNSSSTDASPFFSTYYIVETTDIYGCKNLDSVHVTVIPLNILVVPTAFSPNVDGHNDFFRIIRHLNIAAILEYKVFNRWGEIIFEGDNVDDYWDGTYKGTPQEIGVYVFLIKALTKDGETIVRQGNVTLIR